MLTAIDAFPQSKATPQGLDVICIDPGHGGHDPGCVSRDGKRVQEKDIVLSIGLKLRNYLKEGYPDMKVVMTRDSDKFIELGERAAIANRNGAKLFISIHINSVDPKRNSKWQGVNGFSIHTLGQSRTGRDLYSSNMELCKRENSVILMENDYETKYQGFNPNDPESYIIFNLMQNSNLVQSLKFAEEAGKSLSKGPVLKNRGISQDPFLVLWKTTMPAVLIECGFITGTSDLSKIRTEEGQRQIAENIYKAIISYKKSYDSSVNLKSDGPKTAGSTENRNAEVRTDIPSDAETAPAEVKKDAPKVLYGIQVLASGKEMKKNDPFFAGHDFMTVKSGRLFKYIISVSEKKEETLADYKTVSQKFKGSFPVMIEGEKLTRLK